MKVKKLKASKVNGILNFDIIFNNSISFLIGINGSGKTTALKLLLGLVTPSYKFLNKINFEKASLECETDDGELILILAKKKDEELIDLELKINDVCKAKSQIQLFDKRTKFIDEEEESLINRKFEHLPVVKAIQELKTPIFLGLDRRIFQRKFFEDPRREYERRKYHIRYGRKRHYFSGDPMDMSLVEIQELVNDYIREIAEKQPQLTEEFKSEVLNSSINYYEEGETFNLEGIKEGKLSEKRESLEKAVKNLAIGDFKQRIDNFFIKFENLNKDVKDFSPKTINLANTKDRENYSRLLSQMMMNSWQLRRIDDIIALSQKYQKKIAGLREPLNRLNNILFKFFTESQKKIQVQPNGEFEITLPNGDIATPFELSSGEKQILIMITHLIFYERVFTKRCP